MLCKKPFEGFGCGQCLPCRLNRRRIWSSRLMLEASLHEHTSFLTLTYDPAKAPRTSKGLYTLERKHYQEFFKRLRHEFKFSYFIVGEYGHDGTGFIDASGSQWHPHFHAALYGVSCLGKIQRPEHGLRCFCDVCECVSKKWGHGHITLDELTEQSAAYICGYTVKKMTSPDDVRLDGRYPEFGQPSTRPAIALGAVDMIADALLSEYGYKAFQHGDIPYMLRRGDKDIPLGRYLRNKIRQAIDLEKINPETGEVTYGTPHETLQTLEKLSSPELHVLRQAIIDAPQGEKAKLYQELDELRTDVASTRLQKVLNLEAKHTIQQSRKVKSL